MYVQNSTCIIFASCASFGHVFVFITTAGRPSNYCVNMVTFSFKLGSLTQSDVFYIVRPTASFTLFTASFPVQQCASFYLSHVVILLYDSGEAIKVLCGNCYFELKVGSLIQPWSCQPQGSTCILQWSYEYQYLLTIAKKMIKAKYCLELVTSNLRSLT